MTKEKTLDFEINALLEKAGISCTPEGSDIIEIQEALKTSSKKQTGECGRPDFVGKSGDFIIIIENKIKNKYQADFDSKGNLSLTKKATSSYAENGAYWYAQNIIEKTSFNKVFAFGCSGNKDTLIIRPIFLCGETNDDELIITSCFLEVVDGFDRFSPEKINTFYEEKVLGYLTEKEKQTIDLKKQAKDIHEDLRNYCKLKEIEKSTFVAALFLALYEDRDIANKLTGDDIKRDGEIIFDTIKTCLTRKEIEPIEKRELLLHHFNIIKDRPVLNKTVKELGDKTPLRYVIEKLNKDLFSAIKQNNSEDFLGQFYSEFVRYSGGTDGKSLGIVLTPSRLINLVCELLEIKPTDKIIDPCCGTGSFPVIAMNYMCEQANSATQATKLKKNNIHAIEIREDMFCTSTVSMILHGDGQSNICNRDFLSIPAEELREYNFTAAFMNPPYSQAKSKSTAHLSELRFIEHLLDCLGDNARAAVLVPLSTMFETKYNANETKKRILENHTLEGVITLNENAFYGVGTHTCLAIFTAHQPHKEEKFVKFINFKDDGWIVSPHIGLTETDAAPERKEKLINCWINNHDAENDFLIKSKVEPTDEWIHAFYYFDDSLPTEEDFNKVISDYLIFEFAQVLNGREQLFTGE